MYPQGACLIRSLAVLLWSPRSRKIVTRATPKYRAPRERGHAFCNGCAPTRDGSIYSGIVRQISSSQLCILLACSLPLSPSLSFYFRACAERESSRARIRCTCGYCGEEEGGRENVLGSRNARRVEGSMALRGNLEAVTPAAFSR